MTTSEQTPAGIDNDPRPYFAAATGQFLTLVEGITSEQWSTPTALSDFDVAALCEHLIAVLRRVRHTLSTGSFEGSFLDVSEEDLAAALTAERAQTLDFLTDDSVLTGEVTVPWGQTPATAALSAWGDEFVAHTWDLAIPLDAVGRLDDDLADRALGGFRTKLPSGSRPDWFPFADEIEVGPDANAYDRLAAFTGRDPKLAG